MGAPKGNKFALGNSGRSKIWKNVKDLQKDIDAYFDWCDANPVKMLHNSQLNADKTAPLEYDAARPYTIEGLCGFLECNRSTLLNYEKEEEYEEFFHTIENAKNKIQQSKVERGLLGTAPASTTIFDLKNNHGYKDKTEVDNKTTLNLDQITGTEVL